MRTVKYTNRFKRDYRREKSGRHGRTLDKLLMEVVDMLAGDKPLPRRNFDHPLTGEWNDHHDCHIRIVDHEARLLPQSRRRTSQMKFQVGDAIDTALCVALETRVLALR